MSDFPVLTASYNTQGPTQEDLRKAREQILADLKKVEQTDEYVVFVVGDKKYQIPELHFHIIRQVWGYMGFVAAGRDVVERIDAILRILSVILTSDEEVAERALASEGTQADAMDRKHAELCKDLKTSQWRMLTASYGALMIKSSLLTEEEWAPKLPESEPSPGEAEASSGSNGEAESAGSNPSFSGEGKASQTPSNGHLTLEEFLMETDSPTLMQ